MRGEGGMMNVRQRRYVTPSEEGGKVAGERRRKGGKGCEVSFRPRQQSALSASAASPDRTAGLPHGERHQRRTTVKWALSKKIKIKKRGKKQNSEISLYGQMTSCLPGWNMRKIINNKKKSALIFP